MPSHAEKYITGTLNKGQTLHRGKAMNTGMSKGGKVKWRGFRVENGGMV